MPANSRPRGSLSAYRAKRSAERTVEPFGSTRPRRPHLFVVQKHSASRLHYDFRLELNGTLKSWAVPKGPSPDPSQKRLAVEVEDHPVEYGDFEGIIPEGNDGAGSVIVWDRGRWDPVEDPEEGMAQGKLLFDLSGHKLRGRWQLVRTQGSGKEWLLIKKPDAWASPEGEQPYPEESIFSGFTVDALTEAFKRRDAIVSVLEQAGAPRQRVDPHTLKPMLAETAEHPFSGPGWLFEVKYDGFRLLAAREQKDALLFYRSGRNATYAYPEIATAVAALPYNLVLDGEVVVLDDRGAPSFQSLQKRGLIERPADVERASVELPATYFVFDLLAFEGFDLRKLPLLQRKELLKRLLPPVGPLRYAVHVEERGVDMYESARKLGLEGVVAKRAQGPYRSGRHSDWRKVRGEHTVDVLVVGFTPPQGSRLGFGGLHLAGYESGVLTYVGKVGSGFSDAQLRSIRADLDGLVRKDPPFAGAVPPGRGHTWVEPVRICEIRYHERTEDGMLRHPIFVRLRDDKKPVECVLPPRRAPQAEPEPTPASEEAPRTLHLSNLEKVFWPKEGYRKKDLIDYYRGISPWLLPYLKDRPVVLTRFPDGIEGKSFFQMDAPGFVPAWLRRARMWSEQSHRDIEHFIIEDEESLVYLVNLGTIPLHIWGSRVSTLQRPDFCVVDLDPKGAPFADVVTLAKAVHALCDELGLPCYPKTSGASGMHVMVPLGQQCTFEQARSLAELLARVVAGEHPALATVARPLHAREGKVYVDFGQNGHGRLIVAPFSARPVPGATVSMPLLWKEVNAKLTPARFDIQNAVSRLKKLGEDPLLPVLKESPDLPRALARLSERLPKNK